MAVYDKEKTKPAKPGSHDDLDMPEDERAAEIAQLEAAHSAPSAMEPEAIDSAEKDASGRPGGSKGESAEAGQLDNALDQLGPGYREEGAAKGIKRLQASLAGMDRRKALLGGGVVAGIISLVIMLVVSLLPLKIVHIVENLQNRFFSSSESAVERYTQKLFQKYVNEHVLAAMNKPGCSSTKVNKSCTNTIVGEGKVEKLFRAWRDDNLENKMAKNFGIEFEKRGTQYYLKAPGVGEAVLKSGPGQIPIFEIDDMPEASRATIRAKVTEALDGETRFKRVMYRFKVGRLLERKYGIKRCMFACEGRDKLAEWGDKVDRKRNAAKLQVIRRVVEPHSDMLGFAFACIIDGSCDDGPSRDGDDTQRRDKLEKQIQEYLEKRGREYSQDTVKKIVDATLTIADKGMMSLLIEKLFNKATAEFIGKGVPVVGWINAVATMIKTAEDAGPKLKRWGFVLGSTAMVSYYMLARSHADEQKSGDTTAALTGSFTQMLSENTKNGEPAENSPLYSNLMGSSQQKTALGSLLPSAFAASQGNTKGNYTCDDNNPIPGGKLICPEESLLVSNFVTEFSELFNNGPLAPVAFIARQWKNTGGKIYDKLQGLFGGALDLALKPFGFILDPAKEFMAEKTQAVFTAVIQYLLPSPISDNMSGARSFNMMAGGADAAGSSYAHYGLGGRKLTAAQARQIQSEQEAQRRTLFASKPFFARMFDTDSSYSLVSQVAMAMPTSQTLAMQSSVGSLMNPFAKMFGVFGGARTVSAGDAEDPFGIPQYGYNPNGTAMNTDPDTLTDSYCAQKNKDWADDVSIDPDTGMDVHNSENPCLLLDAAVGSSGALFDDSLLPADELGTPAGGGGTTGGTGTDIVGDMFQDSTNVPCAYGTIPIQQPQDGYYKNNKVSIRLCALPNIDSSSEESRPGGAWYVEGANGKALVNARVSGAWFGLVTAANQAGLKLHAESSFRTYAHQDKLCGGTCDGSLVARPGYSPHQMGFAIDFTGTHIKGTSSSSCSGRARDPSSPVWTWLYQNAETFHIKQYSNESWHWDTLGTASRCGTSQ